MDCWATRFSSASRGVRLSPSSCCGSTDSELPRRHPYEHTHVGLQLERIGGTARVVAVVEGSPAAQAGIAPVTS